MNQEMQDKHADIHDYHGDGGVSEGLEKNVATFKLTELNNGQWGWELSYPHKLGIENQRGVTGDPIDATDDAIYSAWVDAGLAAEPDEESKQAARDYMQRLRQRLDSRMQTR